MNYGDRQERALFLIKNLRENPDQTTQINGMSRKELADHIENMTETGREVVAVAGLVLPIIMKEGNRESRIQLPKNTY
jgi:hypothetical protein